MGEGAVSNQSCGVIWDMDGTLIDSTEYHWQSWRDALAAEDYDLTYEQFKSTYGQRNDSIIRSYLGADVSLSDIDRIGEAKETQYRAMIRENGIDLLPGVQHWLDYLKAQGWKQAIATSAPRLNLETIIEVCHLQGYFTATVSAEDVERGKPDPQVFLLAADRMGIAPERCIVIEDAPAGVEAGKNGGMRTIGVLTSQHELTADQVVSTLDKLPADAFETLLNNANH